MKKYFKAKVEKGYEIPPKKERGDKYIDFLNSLEVGDSFIVEHENEANGIRSAGYWVGMRFILRKVDSEENQEGFTFRMWYAEKVAGSPGVRKSRAKKTGDK